MKVKFGFIIERTAAHEVKTKPVNARYLTKNTDRHLPDFNKKVHVKKGAHEHGRGCRSPAQHIATVKERDREHKKGIASSNNFDLYSMICNETLKNSAIKSVTQPVRLQKKIVSFCNAHYTKKKVREKVHTLRDNPDCESFKEYASDSESLEGLGNKTDMYEDDAEVMAKEF